MNETSKNYDPVRHVGADLLKIISMMMVVSLHTLGYTGGLFFRPNSIEYFIA